MRLEKFRVSNYRSVKDSGWIEVAQQTALVGRNESGKTNLLLALRSLRPPEGLQRLSVATDFPADRSRAEYSDELDVVQTLWALSSREQEALGQIFPRAHDVTRVEVGRGYEPLRWVRFCHVSEPEAPVGRAKEVCERLEQSLGGPETSRDVDLERAYRALGVAVGEAGRAPRAWAEAVREALAPFRNPMDARNLQLGEGARSELGELGELVDQVANDQEAEQAARDWVLHQLPFFLFLDEYPEIHGQQDLAAFVERKRENRPREEDTYFEKLLSVAGLDPNALESVLAADPEQRRQIANRAGATLTRRLRELWHERELKVRFNLDGTNFNTLISDPSSVYDVEVNLDERSKGFRWFFSFYVTFAADAKSGSTENMVLLLDEPGLHLHGLGQRDLLAHFAADFPNQVIYSTHSPFMVPADDVSGVRTVTISEESGTLAHNKPAGDQRTLFPIVHSLAVEISLGLFPEGWKLAVPELSDYWYLQGILDYMREKTKLGLPRGFQIAPAGGCSSLPYLVSLLTGQHQKSLVLLCDPPQALGGRGKEGLPGWLEQTNAVLVSEALPEASEAGADVEDLFEPELYDRFVRYCYRAELKDKNLEPDPQVRRCVERYTRAFARLGLEFSRGRQARLFLRGMGKNPSTVLTRPTRENFGRLFDRLRKKIESLEG